LDTERDPKTHKKNRSESTAGKTMEEEEYGDMDTVATSITKVKKAERGHPM